MTIQESINPNRVIKLPEVQSLTALSRSSVYQYMKDGTFPQSIPLGARAVGWKYQTIISWIDNQSKIREIV